MLLKLLIISVIFINIDYSHGLLKRCYQCRSRGELGSCKDPFSYNSSTVESDTAIQAVPCASGWCGKVIEGGGSFRTDDYDMAVQRMCVQRGPDDSEDRCAFTVFNYKKVYMCFCQGELCNSATSVNISKLFLLSFSFSLVVWKIFYIMI